jgi:hypothetical protein
LRTLIEHKFLPNREINPFYRQTAEILHNHGILVSSAPFESTLQFNLGNVGYVIYDHNNDKFYPHPHLDQHINAICKEDKDMLRHNLEVIKSIRSISKPAFLLNKRDELYDSKYQIRQDDYKQNIINMLNELINKITDNENAFRMELINYRNWLNA